MSETEHGTYAGWNWHKRRAVPMCDDCRRAGREYQRAYRERTGRHYDRANSRATNKALWRLAELHPGQYQILRDQFIDAEIERERASP